MGDAAAFSVYAAKRKRDGWMDVRTGNGPRTNDEDYDQNYHTFRGKLLLEPTDTLDILLSGDFTSREENCCTAVQTTVRSEEHTSELQSLMRISYAVFCLKKKTT